MELVDEIRAACARVTTRARHVEIDHDRLEAYAAELPPAPPAAGPAPELALPGAGLGTRAAFVLALDAINFGSGWWPTIRKRPGRSGFWTVALGLHERFAAAEPPAVADLRAIGPEEVAHMLGQDPGHELMPLFATALRDLGDHVAQDHGGRFLGVVEAAGGSAVALAEMLASWSSFADVSPHAGERVPFFKRAQIAAADLHEAGVARFPDVGRLTLFADNLIPHVLRVDGVLRYAPDLAARIDAQRLLEHDSPEEVEIRACAVHAVELVAARRDDLTPAAIDRLLWVRGGGSHYKARPRHRARTTAY